LAKALALACRSIAFPIH